MDLQLFLDSNTENDLLFDSVCLVLMQDTFSLHSSYLADTLSHKFVFPNLCLLLFYENFHQLS